MKRLLLLSFLSAVLLFSSNTTQGQYFTEDFETAFAGDPPAPTGWTQTMNRPVRHATAEKNWLQNTWTGAAWTVASTGTNPVGAQSGTGVLWIDDYNYNSSSTPQNSRRMESPSIDLTASTSPYLRFWYFNNQGTGVTMNLRIMASANGGATWTLLTPIVNGFTTTANSWNRISVFIPPAYRTATFKFGFEITNRYGTSNPFIDNVSVEEFTPATISSAATGDWNAGATWNGGVVPTADNHVEIAVGHTVTLPTTAGIIGRCQNLTVNGTLAHSTATAVLVHAYGNVVVNGILNAFNGTSGRAFYAGRNFTINGGGTADFSVGTTVQSTGSTTISTGASMLVFLGNQPSSFTNSGTLVNGRINNVMHLNSGGHTYSSAVQVPYTFGLYLGSVSGNLTLGNRPASGVQTVEIANGTFTTNPTWNNTNVTSRSNYYYSPNWVPLTQTTFTPGNEIEEVGGVRTVSGTLTINTHNNIQLGYPLAVGTAATGAGLTLTRGILITDAINILHLAQNNSSASAGTAPSVATPPTTHGSYISGPLKRTYPASGSTSRTFPLGVGTAFNGATPSSNVLKVVTLATGATGASAQSPIVSIVGAPSGGVNAPLTTSMGTRAYRVNLDGGADFPATATITIPAMNYTFGNSDDLLGLQQELRVGQATSLTGTWSERSVTSGTGAFVNNTNYPRTNAIVAPGPIAPIATNGEYFALATTAAVMSYTSSTTTQTITSNIGAGTPNAQVIGIEVVTTGALNPISLTKITVNANGTTSVADIENAKIFYTGTTNTFSTATQYGSTFAAPTVSNFEITGSQTLATGTNYFWLTFDVKAGAINNNLIDAECVQVTVAGGDYIPTVTAPVGSRTIKLPLAGNYEVGAGGDYASITQAITDLNNLGVSGAVTLLLTDASYSAGETFPITIESIVGASLTNTITLKPAVGVTALITGAVNANPLIINKSSYFIVNGSNSGGTSKDLTLSNTSVTTPQVYRMVSTGTTPMVGSQIKNCILINGVNTSSALVLMDVGLAAGGYFNDILIQNNSVQKAYIGIYCFAAVSPGNGSGVLISQNDLTTSGVNAIRYTGIYVQGFDGATLSQNSIANFDGTTNENDRGIWLATATKNTIVSRNSIYSLKYTGTGGYGAYGVNVTTGLVDANIQIFNNVIYNLSGDGWNYTTTPGDNTYGIVCSTTQSGIKLYYNSIHLYGNTLNQTSAISAGIGLLTGSVADIRDNVIVNNLGLLAATGYGSVGVFAQTANTQFSNINFNDYYVNPSGSGVKAVGQIATTASSDLTAWQTATTQDANSISADPQFVSETNLQPFLGSPVLAAGTPIVGVTTDYTGAARHITTPSIGAYESGQATAAVGWANLQWPATANITEGQTFDAYARVWQAGVTPGAGQGAGIESWFGWNATNTDPATWTNWIDGTYNAGFVDDNNDEYTAAIGAGITPGTYYYASRFRTTGGTYQYGGYSVGGGNFWGTDGAVSGVLTVNPITITVPHAEGFEAVTFPPAGWKRENVLGGNVWNRSTSFFRSGVASANITYEVTGGEDWLITPQIIGVVTGDILSFYWRNAFSSPYPPDQLDILVSTTNSNMASFTNVLGTINTANSPNTWTNHTFALDAYNGQNIYIAFKHTNTDGDGGNLDDVVLTKASTTWLGTTNTTWGTGTNWSNGVPLSTQDAVIGVSANNPSLNTAAAVNNLTINNGAVLNVTNGGQLTVNGALTNSAGNTGLVLQSNASGTGSLIHNTTNVPATIQRYITGGQYHFASVPLTDAASPTAALFMHSWLWKYDPTLPNWVKYLNETDALTVTQGYMIWYTGATTTYSFAGNMNNGAFTAATPGGVGTFNLVPNPYPSAINWDAATGWTKTNVANATYIYNNTQYASYVAGVGANGGTNIIPVGQAFFVEATGAATLAMNNSVRTHSSQAYFNEPVINDLFRIAVAINGNSDETVVRFTESATASFDSEYDAAKLYGNASAPQLYTMAADNQMLSINSLSMTEGGVSVPLSFEFSADGEITLQFSGVGSFSELQAIFIEDLLTGSMTDLRQHASYTFIHMVSNDPDRFLLHFRDITGLEESGTAWQVWSNNRKVYVNIPELNGQRASIEMFDVLGSRLFSSEGVLNSPAVVHAMKSGVAIVRVSSADRVYTTKIFIQ